MLSTSPNTPRRIATLEMFDQGFRRRLGIAIAISLAVNAVIFGYAGVLGHQFLHSLVIMREKDSEVSIRRVYLPADKIKAMLAQHQAGMKAMPTPSPLASPSPAVPNARP